MTLILMQWVEHIASIPYIHSGFINAPMNQPGVNVIGNLTNTHPENQKVGFLSFIRLVGCLYFNKHLNRLTQNPFLSQSSQTMTPQRNTVRNGSVVYEKLCGLKYRMKNLLPSWDSLHFHWLRTCWVSTMYQQVYDPHPHLLDPSEHGWQRKDGRLHIYWDTQENMENVCSRVHRLTKGCSCKSGCQQRSNCGCRKKDQKCGPGCR